ncbi:MAG TPA: hypothetical protein VN622_13300 [Clostridia bacterium]|nr:hypothetical protein [Clostridia bacterium]
MPAANCNSIKQALHDHLAAQVSVQQVRDACVVTLPFVTVDQRCVDVFVEPRAADYFLIHDAGKAVNELILQGVKITPSVEREFELIAGRFGISYCDEMFQAGAKYNGLAAQAYAVGMCSALAMVQMVGHVPVVEEEPLEVQLGSLLRRWGRRKAKVSENVQVAGRLKQHTFDFVLTPQKGEPISVSILHPTAGALSAAERFGFKSQDLANTYAQNWRRVAVEAKAEAWSQDAHRIVETFAQAVISVPSGMPADFQQLSSRLDQLAA